MDSNEVDALILDVLGELRQLRPVMTRLADTMVVVNQTCVEIMGAIGRLDARVTLLQMPEAAE